MRYLTKHDLEKRFYGIERYMPGDPSTQDLHLAASSGTTTGLPTLFVARRPVLERDSVYDQWFAPLQSAVRVARNHHIALQNTHRALMSGASNRVMVIAERDMPRENLSRIMSDYKAETLNGPPSRILLWAQRLAESGAEAEHKSIRLIQTFGELLTPLHRKLIKQTFPDAILKNGYSFSGANYPTAECPASDGEWHHILKGPSVTRISIADPDENGIGEIIATTDELENYRTGDLGKLTPIPCPCGESPILTLYGRKDFDLVPILGATFLKSELERVLEPFRERLVDYQLRVGEAFRDGKLAGRAEFDFVPREGSAVSESEISEHLENTLFVTKTRTLSDIIKAGIFMPLFVSRVAEIKRGKKQTPLKRADFSKN